VKRRGGVPSLRYPTGGGPPLVEAVTPYEAVQLFVERARKARPRFELTADNAGDVAAICRRLEGIPLAIELAAARVRVLTPQQIASGLSDRFHLLTGGGPRALPRQRTLEASVDWSHNLLSEEERVLLRRLSVFAGGFTLDAAEAVCASEDIDAYRVLDLLSALVDRSLVQMDDEGQLARYWILETIRQYAGQRLVDAAEGPAIGDRHLLYYVELAEGNRLDRAQIGNVEEMIETLRTEHDNFRSALDWALRAERPDEAMRLGVALAQFWSNHGHTREGFDRLEAILAADGGDPSLRCQTLAWASFVSGFVAVPQGLRYGEEGIALARRLGDPSLLARSLIGLAMNRLVVDAAAVRVACEEALHVAEDIRDAWTDYTGRMMLGFVEMGRGELTAARGQLEGALSVGHRFADDRSGRMWVLWLLGWVSAYGGDVDEAETYAEESLAIARDLGATFLVSMNLGMLSSIAALRGDLDRAESVLTEAEGLAEKLGMPGSLALWRGELQAAQRDYAAAAESFESALRLARVQGNSNGIALSLALLGASVSTYDHPAARAYLDEALDTARNTRTPMGLSWAAHFAGLLARLEGDKGRDEALQHEALAVGVESSNKAVVIFVLDELGGLAAASASFDEAARLFGAADAVRMRSGITNRDFREGPDFYSTDVAAARTGLGDEAFDNAWAEGAAMSLEEAVAYVQRGRGARGRPSAGWSSLTPRELEVVRLVAQGMTNPDIGEKLFLSKRTVQTHLSHIFAKVGVATRAELASEATRREL
jgi:DNA-binding CsgD family transcriptional regulator